MLGLLPAGEKKRAGQDQQYQQLLGLQSNHTYIDNNDNDNNNNSDNDNDNDGHDNDNDNGDNLTLLVLLCCRLIAMIMCPDCVEVGRERQQTPRNSAKVAGIQKPA